MIVVRRVHKAPQDKPLLSCTVVASGLWNLTRVVLVLVCEAAANSFSCLVRKTSTGHQVGWLISFGASCFADDVQMFHVPLAPRTNPEMKL